MIHITARLQGETQGTHQRVNVFAGPDPEHLALVGGLLMLPAEADELMARIVAADIEPTITPAQAAHVLHHYGATGGMEPGSFTQLLITTIDKADREHTLRLAVIYPGYVGAVSLAKYTEDGIRLLQGLARQMLVPAPQDGGAADV